MASLAFAGTTARWEKLVPGEDVCLLTKPVGKTWRLQ